MIGLKKFSLNSSPLSRSQKCSIRFYIEMELIVIFFLPLTMQASAQLDELQNILQDREMTTEPEDQWIYSWGSNSCKPRKTYNVIVGTQQASPLFNWLWSAGNLGKHKFFFWLLLRGRLNTTNLLRRKNMYLEDYSRVLCNTNTEESCFHLFFKCPFSRACWNTLSICWNYNLNPLDMLLQASADFGSSILEVVITACWEIWKARSGIIFDGKNSNILT